MLQEYEMPEKNLDEQKIQMMELNNKIVELQHMTRKIDDIEKVFIKRNKIQEKLQESKQETKKWRDFFSYKVQTLVTDVEKVHHFMANLQVA